MRETELYFLDATPLLPLAEVAGHVTEIERSLVEVAVVEVILGLETFLRG